MLFFNACKKEGTNVIFTGGNSPVLSASLKDTIVLSSAIKNNQAISFSWTNPNYQFSNGISSMNVTYNLEIDTLGSNFSNPNMQIVQVVSDLGKSFTVDDLNALLGNKLKLKDSVVHNIQVRVVSFINPYTSGSAQISPLTSNVLNFVVDTTYTPPPAVTPPASGTLYLVGGDPLIGAWANVAPAPTANTFIQKSATDYQLTVALSGGDPTNSNASDQYLIVPVAGSWSHKYSCSSTANQPFSGGTFGLDLSSNFPGPTAPGNYLIDVNFQSGIITVTKQ